MADSIRAALERAAQELELVAGLLIQAGWAAAGSRARNESHAARAALAAQPATDTPLDLDVLLSPKGAYEPGIGQEDGAQLLTDRHNGNPQWWAPVYGCDTLENLLDRIRERILPHLRPPISGIDVPGGDGDYGDVLDLCAAEGVHPRVGVRLLKRAREAWKVAAQPPAAAPASDGELVNLAGCVAAWAARLDEGTPEERLLGRVAEVLKQRQAPPHDGEVDALIKILSRIARMLDFMPDGPPNGPVIHRVIELLRQPAPAPAAVPVAVSERPWEREGWLHPEDNWCWWHAGRRIGGWVPQWPAARPVLRWGFLLPYWAIPIPQPPQGGEVEPAATPDTRNPKCVAAWPDCYDGGFNPRCCRFPKSCSCEVKPPQGGDVQP